MDEENKPVGAEIIDLQIPTSSVLNTAPLVPFQATATTVPGGPVVGVNVIPGS
jgi:hypothetical protein